VQKRGHQRTLPIQGAISGVRGRAQFLTVEFKPLSTQKLGKNGKQRIHFHKNIGVSGESGEVITQGSRVVAWKTPLRGGGVGGRRTGILSVCKKSRGRLEGEGNLWKRNTEGLGVEIGNKLFNLVGWHKKGKKERSL